MTDYKFHGIDVVTETLNEHRRYVRHEPQVRLLFHVGKRDKFSEMPLAYEDLLKLNGQVAAALQKLHDA